MILLLKLHRFFAFYAKIGIVFWIKHNNRLTDWTGAIGHIPSLCQFLVHILEYFHDVYILIILYNEMINMYKSKENIWIMGFDKFK